MSARTAATWVLLVLAVATGIAAWLLRPKPEEPSFVGPIRSDYTLRDFTVTTLDAQGQESFRMQGPHLTRDPYTETFAVDKPQFQFPQDDGSRWEGRSEDAWISAKGEEVRLTRGVELLGPPRPAAPRTRMVTDRLTVFPKANTARSDAEVTVTDRDSILRGRGLEADLQAKTYQLLADVSARYEPTPR